MSEGPEVYEPCGANNVAHAVAARAGGQLSRASAGRTTALNAAACCVSLSSIPPVHQAYGLVADVPVSLPIRRPGFEPSGRLRPAPSAMWSGNWTSSSGALTLGRAGRGLPHRGMTT